MLFIYEWAQQADPREKRREDQAWHQFRKCDFPVFPEKMEIVRGPSDGKKKRRDASLAVWGKASEETFSFSSLLWIFPK